MSPPPLYLCTTAGGISELGADKEVHLVFLGLRRNRGFKSTVLKSNISEEEASLQKSSNWWEC